MPSKKRRKHPPHRNPRPQTRPKPSSDIPVPTAEDLKLMKLQQNLKLDEIIRRVEPIPPQQRSPYAALVLATAYTGFLSDAGTFEYFIRFQKARSTLEAVRQSAQSLSTWYEAMGFVLHYTQRDRLAELNLAQCCRMEPDDAHLRRMLNDTRRSMRMPVFQIPFSRRVAMTWEDFSRYEADLKQQVDGADDVLVEGVSPLVRCLFRVLNTFQCSLFQSGGRSTIAFWLLGSDACFLRLRYLLRHAPASLLERWNFLLGQPEDPWFEMEKEGIPLSSQDVLVWAERQEDGTLRLRMFCRNLLPLIRTEGADSDHVRSLFRDLLFRAVGELAIMGLPYTLEVLSLPVPGEPFLLSGLRGKLEDLGYRLSNDPQVYASRPGDPWPLPPSGSGPRFDILEGVTWCRPLVEEYQQGKTDLVEDWHAYSICPGFVYWPAEGMVGTALEDFRSRLIRTLRSEAGEDAVDIIGWASGSRWHYLDFVAWDSVPVFRSIRGFFHSESVSGACFHSFFPAADSVPVEKL